MENKDYWTEEVEVCLCGKISYFFICIKWALGKKLILIKNCILWCFGKYCFHKWIRVGKKDLAECTRCKKTVYRLFPPEHFNCRSEIIPL